MQSISSINNISNIILIAINAGCVFRMLFCLLFIMKGDPSEQMQMKKRIKHIIFFMMVANGIYAITALAQSYWG